MLNAISIALDTHTLDRLNRELSKTSQVKIVRNFAAYPPEYELSHYIQASAPAIAFLNMENLDQAISLAMTIDRTGTGTQVIALDSTCNPERLLKVMQAGIREIASTPFDGMKLTDSIARIADMVERRPSGADSTAAVYAFLPAKPGGGTSTIAINVAAAIARGTQGGTLLADLDLNLGMISFQLKITNPHSIVDALQHADHMDESLWTSLVTTVDDLHVLCSGRLYPGYSCDPAQVRKMLDFARRNYQTICIDLSGNMEPYSIEVLQQAREIFLVCTPDVSSLHLGRGKAHFMRDIGVGDRVSVLMNRSEKRNPLSLEETERVLGVPVRFSFENDPRHVADALISGSYVESKTQLGKQFDALAKSLQGTPRDTLKAVPPKLASRRFVDYFSITPADSHSKTVWTETSK